MKSILCALPLVLLLSFAAFAEPPAPGRVTGRILVEGAQDLRGVASLWEVASGKVPDPRKYILIPSAVASLTPDGRFELQAPPGTYYVGALVRRTPGAPMGPPRPGDLVFLSPDRKGEFLTVEVRSGETVDLGARAGGWVYEGFTAVDGPTVTGTVRERGGGPVSRLLVFAFADPGMSEQPVAVSDPTDAAGRYTLRLNRPQEVYLVVREAYGGGPPAEGQYIGVYGGGQPQGLKVSAEGRESIDIEVFKLPPLGSEERRRMRPAGREAPPQ